MKIRTNNQWRNFCYREDVPAKVLESQFDYQDPDDTVDGFFQYRGYWYHVDQFMRCEAMPDWDGAHGDSFFSGILIKFSPDGEQFKVATYIS
jgi:hypothetical protein